MANKIGGMHQFEAINISSDSESDAGTGDLFTSFIERHMDLYNIHDSMRPLFENYLTNLVKVGGKAEFAELSDIEAPSGSLQTNIAFILHWPPKQKGLKACGTIVENQLSPSINWVRKVFPDFDVSTAFDLVPKREFLYDPVTRERQKIHKLYRSRDTFEEHLAFTETIVRSLECTTNEGNLFLFGSHVKSWFKQVFGDVDSIPINGKTWHVHYIHHPEFLRRWAPKQERVQTVGKLLHIAKRHSLQVDSEFLANFADKGASNIQQAIDSLLEEEDERINHPPTQEYIENMTQATNAVKKRIRDQRKSPRMRQWWKLLEDHNVFWHNYCDGFADHYHTNSEEGHILAKTTKVGWLSKFMAKLAEVTSAETLASFKKQMTASMHTPEAQAKMKATVEKNLADQEYRARVFGPEHVVDADNYVECSRCRRSYKGIKQLKAHWGHSHDEHDFNESTSAIYHGDKEPQWACYGTDENGSPCTETKRDKGSMKRHLLLDHNIVHGPDDTLSSVLVPRRAPKDVTHKIGDYSSALDVSKQNNGNAVIKLFKCWVTECGKICDTKANLKGHFERNDHATKHGIKWNTHEADRKAVSYSTKFEHSEFRCYVAGCAESCSTLATLVKHFNYAHRNMLFIDLDRVIEIAKPVKPQAGKTRDGSDDLPVDDDEEAPPLVKKTRTPKFGACSECYKFARVGCNGDTPCNYCIELGTEDLCMKQPRGKTKTGDGFQMKKYSRLK